MKSDKLPLELTLEFSSPQRVDGSAPFPWEKKEYRVKHTRGDGANACFPWHLPWLRPVLESLGRIQPSPDVLEQLGSCLLEFLGTTNWSRDAHEIERALDQGRPVHLTIRSDNADEMYHLPWELLPLSSRRRRLAGLEDCLLRYECLPAPTRKPVPVTGGRILFAYAAAGGAIPVEEHCAAIRKACAERGFFFDLKEDVVEASRKTLAEKLNEKERPVTLLHLLCHGAPVSETAYGLALAPVEPFVTRDLLAATDLRDLLFSRPRALRLVSVCACHGGDAGTPAHPLGSVARMFHQQGVPAVVASRMPLSSEGSILLAETLFEQLLGGGNLRTALSAARRRLNEGLMSRDWLSLQLYGRAGDEGALFPSSSLAKTSSPASAASADPGRRRGTQVVTVHEGATMRNVNIAGRDLIQGRKPRGTR